MRVRVRLRLRLRVTLTLLLTLTLTRGPRRVRAEDLPALHAKRRRV